MTFTDQVQAQLSSALAVDTSKCWVANHSNNGIQRRPSTNRSGTTWTDEDHQRFLVGLEMFPSGPWKKIAEYIGTKTTRQTISHAQKYRNRIAQMNQSDKPINSSSVNDTNKTREFANHDVQSHSASNQSPASNHTSDHLNHKAHNDFDLSEWDSIMNGIAVDLPQVHQNLSSIQSNYIRNSHQNDNYLSDCISPKFSQFSPEVDENEEELLEYLNLLLPLVSELNES